MNSTEQAWHDAHFAGRTCERVPQSIVNRYLYPKRQPLFPLERMFRLCGAVRGKRVLVVGCGDSNTPVLLALAGAEIYASDISIEAVRFQAEQACANGVDVWAAQEDVRVLERNGRTFDIVFVAAVLHHVPDEMTKVMAEIRRVLKPDGFAVVSEPVCLSPFMRWLRRIAPVKTDLSPDERQLTPQDIAIIAPAETYFYHCFSRLRRFIPWLGFPLAFLDAVVLRLAPRFAGICVWKVRP